MHQLVETVVGAQVGIDDALPPKPLLDTDPLLNPNRSRSGGFKPTLVEHAPALRDGGYVIDFWGLEYDIAERRGLREINRIGYHIREMRIANGRGRRISGFGTRVFLELIGGVM